MAIVKEAMVAGIHQRSVLIFVRPSKNMAIKVMPKIAEVSQTANCESTPQRKSCPRSVGIRKPPLISGCMFRYDVREKKALYASRPLMGKVIKMAIAVAARQPSRNRQCLQPAAKARKGRISCGLITHNAAKAPAFISDLFCK